MDKDAALQRIRIWLDPLIHLPAENHLESLELALLQGLRVALLSPSLARKVYLGTDASESFARDFVWARLLDQGDGLNDDEVENHLVASLATESYFPSIATWDDPDVYTN